VAPFNSAHPVYTAPLCELWVIGIPVLLFNFLFADQQKEATADLQLAADFLRQEYADQLGPNYTELNSVPLMLARLRPAKHHHADPAHPKVTSPYPSGQAPAASSVDTTPTPRYRRRRPRRRRSGAIQQPDVVAATSVTPASLRDSLRPFTDREIAISDRELTAEMASSGTAWTEEESGTEMVDKRSEYAQTLLKIAHGLHYGSIAILGVFVIQVRMIPLLAGTTHTHSSYG